ncbi:MAG: hypothetical protein LQ338_007719 [Usnochroma carphineum]|nr:MAG: hypothetical protein LQ338_007719 [Usnochroma carphineum]
MRSGRRKTERLPSSIRPQTVWKPSNSVPVCGEFEDTINIISYDLTDEQQAAINAYTVADVQKHSTLVCSTELLIMQGTKPSAFRYIVVIAMAAMCPKKQNGKISIVEKEDLDGRYGVKAQKGIWVCRKSDEYEDDLINGAL